MFYLLNCSPDHLINIAFRGGYAFLHELGHNFGGGHDKSTLEASTPPKTASFSYGKGKLFLKGEGDYDGYHTIMA